MKLNSSLLEEFEKYINTISPEKGPVSIRILGYGEISLVFEIEEDQEPIAYKRLPIFENERQVSPRV